MTPTHVTFNTLILLNCCLPTCQCRVHGSGYDVSTMLKNFVIL